MKVRLVFDDWRNKNHQSIYETKEGMELSLGSFHSGTIFHAEIALNDEDADDLKKALDDGNMPVFYVVR